MPEPKPLTDEQLQAIRKDVERFALSSHPHVMDAVRACTALLAERDQLRESAKEPK